MSLVTEQELNDYREECTREVQMPDGTVRSVRLPPEIWEDVDFLNGVEGITTEELVPLALDELKHQPGSISFDYAFRIVVVHLANRWTA